MPNEFQIEIEQTDESSGSSATQVSGRAPRISQADVFRAADELLVEGHRPTIDRVRMRLGRGSPNTINDHLDAWWAKLGARLRDLPGREFPQLPERVAESLRVLWMEALEGAREALQSTLSDRERAVNEREQALEARDREIVKREDASRGRTAALEEALNLAREQLGVANRRADTLDVALQQREAELARLTARLSALDADVAALNEKADREHVAWESERTVHAQRHEATEARWLQEVDRARQTAKDAERQLKEQRTDAQRARAERDRLKEQLLEARSELKTAMAVREQLDARVQELLRKPLMPGKSRAPQRVKRVRKAPRKS